MLKRTAVILGILMTANACQEDPVSSGPTISALEDHFNHNAAAGADKGYIRGWRDGEDVSIHYTKSYFCKEPPESGADSGCEVGAAAEIAPHPGELPKIYAIAPAGISVDVSTLSCPPGSVCLNHPAMLDISRIRPGMVNVPAVPHSHILDGHRAGWHQTVNIRVFSAAVWDEIVAAKSLARVRELQADPAVGGAGLIAQDTPTNIFFFIQVQHQKPQL